MISSAITLQDVAVPRELIRVDHHFIFIQFSCHFWSPGGVLAKSPHARGQRVVEKLNEFKVKIKEVMKKIMKCKQIHSYTDM